MQEADVGVGQRAVVEEVPVDAVGEKEPEFRIEIEALVIARDVRGANAGQTGIARPAAREGEGVQGGRSAVNAAAPFAIPYGVAPHAIRGTLAGGHPVVGRPVAHRLVNVQAEVIDKVGDIKTPRHLLIDGRLGHVLAGDVAVEAVVFHEVAVDHGAELFDHVPAFFTLVGGGNPVLVRALGGVEEADVLTVDEEVDHIAVNRDRSLVGVQAARHLIADEGIQIVVPGAQDDLIKALHGRAFKERILQLARPIGPPEIHAVGKLVGWTVAGPRVVAAVGANAAVDLKARVVGWLDHLERERALPGHAVLGGIVIIVRGGGNPQAAARVVAAAADAEDAGRAVKIIRGGDERQHGQRLDGRRGVENVGVSHAFRRQVVGAERGGANHGRVRQGQRCAVNRAGQFRRLASVRRVANLRTARCTGKGEVEGLAKKTARHAEVDRRNDADDGADPIGSARRGRSEIAEHAVRVRAIGTVVALLGVSRAEAADQHARRVWRIKPEMLAVAVQFEVGVEAIRAGGRLDVLARGEDDEVGTRSQRARWETPESGQLRVIAQGIVGQVDRRRALVVNLDPRLRLVVLVHQTNFIPG